MPRRNQIRRRDVLEGSAWALSAAATGALLLRSRRAPAQEELPHLSEDDDMAKALMYVHDATTAPEGLRGENEFCYNCQHFMGDQQTAWAGCAIFPGKAVNTDGWCNVWVEKQE